MTKENRFEGLMDAVGKSQKAQTSNHSTIQPSKKAKSVNPDYTRTTVYLPKKMHKQLKAIALDEEKAINS